MAIRVLGPLQTGDNTLSPRERAILGALVVRGGAPVTPDELAEAYWGDTPPKTWAQQIKTSVARIRSRLGHDAVVTLDAHYALGIDPITIDAVEFERLVSQARLHAEQGEHERAVDGFRRSLGLWTGRAFPELAEWGPAREESARLAAIRRSVEEELLEARLALGGSRAVIAEAERAVRAEPLREDRWAMLALANYRIGRQAEALATIRAARARLAEELGIEPSARLRDLEAAILRQDEGLDPVTPSTSAADDGRCPYRGLSAFDATDADLFFGREEEIDAILARIRPGSLLTVVGASGSGKSSLLRAGVIPREREAGRRCDVVPGGPATLDALRTIAQRPDPPDILLLDQAEAVFALTDSDVYEVAALLDAVRERRSSVVVTLRSDFLDRAISLERIGPRIAGGLFALGPLTEAGLRQAITAPAGRSGLRIEPGLVELIVRDAGDRSTTLPHVSHALQETWTRREGSVLTVDGYENAGGIAGAIAQSAERVYQSLDAADAAVCRGLMLRLIQRDSDGRSTRRSVPLAALLADDRRRHVLDELVATRLLTTDGESALVAHEAIAAAWPRLDGWLAEDAEGARLVATIAAAAELWDASGRRQDDLLRGARLQAALDWREASEPDLTAIEQALIDASAAHRRDEVRMLADRAARDRRANRRLRWAIAGAGVLLVAALVGGGIAVVQSREAQSAAADARASAENAGIEALTTMSVSISDNDRETAALLAAEAYRRWGDDPRVRSALWGIVSTAGGQVDTHHVEDRVWPSLAVVPGTETAVRVGAESEGGPNVAEIVDLATGDVVRALDVALPPAVPGWTPWVAVSPDAATAVIAIPTPREPPEDDTCCWHHVTYVDLAGDRSIGATGPVRLPMSEVFAVDWVAGILYGVHAVTADLIAIDSETGETRGSTAQAVDEDFQPESAEIHPITILDDGTVAVGTGDSIRIHDAASLAIARTIPLHRDDVSSTGLIDDGDGGLVATGWNGTVRVDAATGEELWYRFPDATRGCTSLLRATDETVACGSWEGVAMLELATGETLTSVPLHHFYQPALAPVDDESILAVIVHPAVWMRWRVDGGSAGADVFARGRVLVHGPEAGGSIIVTQPVGGGPMRLWDIERDESVGDESAVIIPLGSGIVARFDDYLDSQGGTAILEAYDGSEQIPLDLTDLPERYRVTPGAWGRPAFAYWPGSVIAFDPVAGQALGPPMTAPDDGESQVVAVTETADAAHAVVTWRGPAGDTETMVYEIDTGEIITRGLIGLESHEVVDEEHLVGVSAGYARVYELDSFRPVTTLARSVGGSDTLTVSADGRMLLNTGFNGKLTLYDLDAGIPLADPLRTRAPKTAVDTVVFPWVSGGHLTSDGESLLEALPDGIRIWDLRPAQQAATACALAGRELTAEEWTTYFPGEEKVATCALLADGAETR